MRRTFARLSFARDSARNHKGLSFSWQTFLKPLFFASCTSFLAVGTRAMHSPCSARQILLAVVRADNCRRLKTVFCALQFLHIHERRRGRRNMSSAPRARY